MSHTTGSGCQSGMSHAQKTGMTGKLRLNSIGRWEIVDESDKRVELTSGDVLDVKVGGVWIRTHIECGWNDHTKTPEYYATTWGVRLCEGLPARDISGS